MKLTWYALNNTASLDDLEHLSALGIQRGTRSALPMHITRDYSSARWLVEIGEVYAYQNGEVVFTERCDTPETFTRALVRTALDCFERDLHRRDHWDYRAATKKRPGYWYATIHACLDRDQLERVLTTIENKGLTTRPFSLESDTRRFAAV